MGLEIKDLSVEIGGSQPLRRLSLTLEPGNIVGLVGPNGSGKSTALRCVYRSLQPTGGAVHVDGIDITTLTYRDSARRVAALPQDPVTDLDFTVAEAVAMGRTPHRGRGRPMTARDRRICVDSMRHMDVLHLADRGILSLSGGERQRVLIARALAQTPRVLVLDEPTNHLDLHHRLALLRLLRRTGLSVLVVLHDLNLAAAVCDTVAVMSDGLLVAAGTPSRVLTTSLLRDVFEVEATIVRHPVTDVPQRLFDLSEES